MQHANFAQIANAGVHIAIGSDGISGEEPFVTALGEAWYLHENAFADNLTLLKMWSETTAQTIFPSRKLGQLAPGYEANFLVLEGDPIADFANVKRIRERIRHGVSITVPSLETDPNSPTK
jgi:imidazolonepropionase-like amidohydrolase